MIFQGENVAGDKNQTHDLLTLMVLPLTGWPSSSLESLRLTHIFSLTGSSGIWGMQQSIATWEVAPWAAQIIHIHQINGLKQALAAVPRS